MAEEKYRVVLDENSVERAEPLMGLVSAPPGDYVLSAVDCYGREVVHEDIRVTGKALPFSYRLNLVIAVPHRLMLLKGSRKVAETRFCVAPPRGERDWNDYHICVWARYPDGFYDLLRDAGVDASMAYRANAFDTLVENDFPFYVEQIASSWLAYYHRSGIPNWTELFRLQKEAYRKHRPHPGKGLWHAACLSREGTYDAMERRIAKEVMDHRFFRPLYYNASDEAGITDLTTPLDLCFSPDCMKRFRRWLRGRYGDLNALNREWGTAFQSWDMVVPKTADEVLDDPEGNYSAWADHRDFMDHVLASAFARAGEMMRKYDPEALCGLEGGQMPAAYGGYNWWLLGGAVDVHEIYNIGHNCEAVRSLHPGKVMLKAMFAQGTDWDVLRVWYELLHGDMGLILWDNGEEKARWIHPNKKYSKHAVMLAPVFREIRSGVARLLRGAKRVDDPIGIHYSQPSIRAAWIRETEHFARQGVDWLNQGSAYGRQNSEFLGVRESLGQVIEDLGLQYRYRAYEQVEQGLSPEEFKVFFLPESAAISEKEARALRRYVERGGVLVADCLAGAYDGHVKRQKKGLLDDLFGIRRVDNAFLPVSGGIGVVRAEGPFAGLKGIEVVDLAAAEPGIEAAGATGCGISGGVPALMYRKVGKGTAVYLNVHNPHYRRLRLEPRSGAADAIRRLYGSIIRFAGVRAKVGFAGGNPPGVEVHTFEDSRLRYVAFMHNPHLRVSELGGDNPAGNAAVLKPYAGEVRLPRARHVYDLRGGKYLGRTRAVGVAVPRTEPAILSLLPYRVAGIAARFAFAPERGKAAVLEGKVATAGGKAGRHVVHISLRTPDGREPHYYRKNIEAPGGRFSHSVPLPFNAARGRYTLTLKDVATGATKALTFILR